MHFTLTLISSHHLFSFFSLHTCIMPWSNYGRCFFKYEGGYAQGSLRVLLRIPLLKIFSTIAKS